MIFIIFEKFLASLFCLSHIIFFCSLLFFVSFQKKNKERFPHNNNERHNKHTQQEQKKINRNQSSSNQMQGARQSDVFFGERESGQDVRQSNVTAVQAVANIVKSSLGPVGLDKVF